MKRNLFLITVIAILFFTNSVSACIPHINDVKIKSIYGKVSLADGKQEIYPDALVKILKPSEVRDKDGVNDTEYKFVAETKTDENGYFRFTNLKKGKYVIIVETEHFKRFWHPVKLTRTNYGKKPNKELVIYLSDSLGCNETAEVHKIKK